MREDGFAFEEQDDERTFGEGLTPDCERASEEKQPEKERPEEEQTKEEPEKRQPVIEYLGEFKACIDACGMVSYFMNMRNFVRADVNKAKNVASTYNHDLAYYTDQKNEWVVKARRSFSVLTMLAEDFGYELPEENRFLNALTLSIDRRSAFKGYLKTCFSKEKALSPQELEDKFQNLLRKRLERRR